MNIILTIFGSIFVSFTIDIIYEVDYFKEVARRGYKIDLNKQSNNRCKNHTLLMFIPVFNLFYILNKCIKYEKEKNQIFSQLDQLDFFVKMDEEEHKKYLDNPKSVVAINMSIDLSNRNYLNNSTSEIIEINNGVYKHIYDDGKFNEIRFNRENNFIIVTDLSGEISKLNYDKQYEEINRIFKSIYDSGVVVVYKKAELIENHENNLTCCDELYDSRIENGAGPVLRMKK